MIWLKALHLAAIAVWSAGLLALPGLYLQRAGARGPDLHRLQRMARFLFGAVASPAAFVAIGSGTALIFVQQTFAPWFALKLLLVGGLAAAHLLSGLVIARLFDEGGAYPRRRFLAATAATAALALAILTVVLVKPEPPGSVPPLLAEPGGLSRALAPLNPFR